MKLMQCSAFALVAALVCSATPIVAAAESCFDDQPVGTVVITVGAEAQGSRTSAFFPVMVGSSTLTQAAVTVSWEKRGGVVRFTPRFHYEMPGSVGLAYNFYQALWAGPAGMVRRDLTQGCTSPGVSIFPNQSWNASEYSFSVPDVPGTTVVFAVWGGLG